MRITFRPQYGDLKIIYAFGSESLADTVSNIYLAGDRVTNEELQDQFHSLSDRLLEGMPEDPGGELGNDAGVAAQEGLMFGERIIHFICHKATAAKAALHTGL